MANLDTPSKRASSVQMLLWSILTPVLPDGTIAVGDRQHTAHAYSGIASTVSESPEDNDSDTSYTAYTDRDGATLRVPRLDVMTAADSCSNADLGNVERIAADRYLTRALRIGRGRTLAGTHRLLVRAYRAGDAVALKTLIVEYEAIRPSQSRIRADNTTSKTDREGASLVVPAACMFHAADSVRNSDLTPTADDQDRWRMDFYNASAKSSGTTHRVILRGSGRAGAPLAIRAVVLEYSIVGAGSATIRSAAL